MSSLVENGRSHGRSILGPARWNPRPQPRKYRTARTRRPVRAFTIVDLLVSIAVIAILISLMLPSLGKVKQTAHQVVCRSGIRQIGMGIAMFADERRDRIPGSTHVRNLPTDKPAETLTLREQEPQGAAFWDGLGILYQTEYLDAPGIFYCPAHQGDHRILEYEKEWRSNRGRIVGNYQYRAMGPNGEVFLSQFDPRTSALASDGMRTIADFSHVIGANVLRADLSVFWFRDSQEVVAAALGPDDGISVTTPQGINFAWTTFDQSGR